MTEAVDNGGSVRLRQGYRQGLACAGLRQGSGTGGSVVQGATPAVTVGDGKGWELRETAAAEAGTQGFAGTAEEGRGNEKREC